MEVSSQYRQIPVPLHLQQVTCALSALLVVMQFANSCCVLHLVSSADRGGKEQA